MSGKQALIGATGFVGSNLLLQRSYAHMFNSTNIASMSGKSFDTVICAAPQARKWWANQNPREDWEQVGRLMDVLGTVEARRFVLISTIDVYGAKEGIHDDADCYETEQPYGRHRRALEVFVRQRFAQSHRVRLPGLFGPGLKKNVVFDLMHGNELAKINPASTFQWYDVSRLADDIDRVVAADLAEVLLATEPLSCATLVERLFPQARIGAACGPAVSYAIRSRHAGLWGGRDGFMLDAERVLADMRRYLQKEAHAV